MNKALVDLTTPGWQWKDAPKNMPVDTLSGGAKQLQLVVHDANDLSSHRNHMNKSKIDRSMDMLSAVTTLRCLTTPGCYPTAPCASEMKPKNLQVKASWEQHSFCTSDLVSRDKEDAPPCLVYSFGINDNIEWESKMASTFGCEVYAFDPTSKKLNATPAKNVYFHKLGLQGVGSDVSATNARQYDAIDPKRLRGFGEIIEKMGHKGRDIDVLRLDCEGCEYGVLNQLACSGDSNHVKQMMIEFHWQKRLGLGSDEDVIIAAEAIQCLERERWRLVSLEKSGCGLADAEYIDSVLRIIRDPLFLLLATFRRLPPSELLPWQVYKEVTDASWELEKVHEVYSDKYNRHAAHYTRPLAFDQFETE